MSVTVNHSVTSNLPHQATLADLEEFITAAKAAGMSGSARLSIEKYPGGQRDLGYTTITVRQR